MLAGLFLISGLSGLSLPGLSTFVSEFLVLVGTFSRYKAAGHPRRPSASSWPPSTSCGCTSAR